MGLKQEGPSGQIQEVDVRGRAHSDAVVRDDLAFATEHAEGFCFATADVSLTTANASNVFYLKNSYSDRNLVIPRKGLSVNCGLSTGGPGGDGALAEIIHNPTQGTLISGATVLETKSALNMDPKAGIPSELVGYVGAEGSTLTDGDDGFSMYIKDASRYDLECFLILPPGKAMAVKITPPASNTAMNVRVVCQFNIQRRHAGQRESS